MPESGREKGGTRRYGETAGVLTVVLATSGLLTYAFFVLSSHSLSADSYGALVVLWSAVFIIVSTAFRPVELLLSRTVAAHETHGEPIGPTLRIGASIQLMVGAVFVVLALIFRGPIEDQLLDGRETFYVIALVSVLLYSGAYFGRGLLAGQRRFRLFALLLLIDSSARLAFAIAVAVGIAGGVNLAALGIVVGPLLSLLVIPIALVRKKPADIEDAWEGAPTTLTLSRGSVIATSLFVALLCEQVLLSTGALFVQGELGTAAAGFMFNIMLVARAPVMLFQAVAASLLPHLTRLRSTGTESSADASRLSVRLTIEVVIGFAAAVTLVVALIGPTLMQIAFGGDFDYARLDLIYVGIGLGFYLAASTLNQAAIAYGRAPAAAVCWVIPALAFVVWNLASPLEALRAAEVGFAAASALLWASLMLLYRTEARRAVAPGELPSEVEAALAAADESL